MLFINNNYNAFTRLHLNASLNEDNDRATSIVDYFNKCHKRNKKAILMVYAKCDSTLLNKIDASFSSVILTDNHWQTDSDALVKQIITRWYLNCIISGNDISAIYKLCSFGSREPFFLTHDLSFVYDNVYVDTNCGEF